MSFPRNSCYLRVRNYNFPLWELSRLCRIVLSKCNIDFSIGRYILKLVIDIAFSIVRSVSQCIIIQALLVSFFILYISFFIFVISVINLPDKIYCELKQQRNIYVFHASYVFTIKKLPHALAIKSSFCFSLHFVANIVFVASFP